MISDAELDAMLGRAVVASICTPTAMPSPTDDVNVLIGEVRRLRTALAVAKNALSYMTQPTMGFPGDQGGPWEDLTPPALPDPEWWVRNGYGKDEYVRAALATCIGMAKSAIAQIGEGADAGDLSSI